jgi:antitoxin (DNA-binding transcriptional repressor) of toxin-antitoxin stability system
MRAVGLEVLENRLSEYVRLAAAGETVLITDRDIVVAELIPPRNGRAETVDDVQLAQLVREGIIDAPLLGDAGAPPRRPVAPTAQVLADLARDRDER